MNPPIREDKHTLTWNGEKDCTFAAEITNGVITDMHFCEPPAKVESEQTCIRSTNEAYLRQVAANLAEMFRYIDQQRSKKGSFATVIEN